MSLYKDTNPNHLSKAPPPSTITQGVRISTYELGVGGHIHSVHCTADGIDRILGLKRKGCVWQQLIAVGEESFPILVTDVHLSSTSKETADTVTGETEPKGGRGL